MTRIGQLVVAEIDLVVASLVAGELTLSPLQCDPRFALATGPFALDLPIPGFTDVPQATSARGQV